MFEQDMGNLNSRLATIVDRNNGIQAENARLREQLESIQRTHATELEKVKDMYESELGEARRLLDIESNKKVESDLELKNARLEMKELKEKAKKHEFRAKAAEDMAEKKQVELDNAKAEVITMRRQHQNLQTAKDELTLQLTNAKSDLDKSKKNAERIDVQRLQLANDLQSAKEMLEMAQRVHKQEMDAQKELSARALTNSVHEQSLAQNATMSRAIEDIKMEHENQLSVIKNKEQERYKKKLADMQRKLDKNGELLAQKRQEGSSLKAKADQATMQLERVEKELARARDDLRAAEAEKASQKATADWNIEDLQKVNVELKTKADKLEHNLESGKEKYSSLLKEVETYRSLLEVEENRLNITPSPVQTKKRSRSRVGTMSEISPTKKARIEAQVEDVGNDAEPTDGDASCAIM